MEIRFPGGAAVDAVFKGHTIHTDQPERAGGGGTGPAPFDLFLASIGTCAGYYALAFCQQRGLSTDDLEISLALERDPERPRLSGIKIQVRLPDDFPEKYRSAIVRSIDQCAVKRHIQEPPEIVTSIV